MKSSVYKQLIWIFAIAGVFGLTAVTETHRQGGVVFGQSGGQALTDCGGSGECSGCPACPGKEKEEDDDCEPGEFDHDPCKDCVDGEIKMLSKEIEGELCKECVDGETKNLPNGSIGEPVFDPGKTYDFSSYISSLESTLNGVPRIQASGFSLTGTVGMSVQESCCEGESGIQLLVNGSVGVGGTVGVDILPWHATFVETWDGYGSIDAEIGVQVTPSLNLSATLSASGVIDELCDGCVTVGANAAIAGNLNAFGGGQITLSWEPGWFWSGGSTGVAATIVGDVDVTAGACGVYQEGSGCEEAGGDFSGYVTETEMTVKLLFQVLQWTYDPEYGPHTLIEGFGSPCS